MNTSKIAKKRLHSNGKMDKKKKLKILLGTLIPIGLVGIALGITLPLTIKCSTDDPTNYIGNMYGTDWKGYKSGTLDASPINKSNAGIVIGTAYVANNLIIPDKVKDNNGKIYNLTLITPSAFKGAPLTGDLTIGNNIVSIQGSVFNKCTSLNGNLTIGNNVVSIGDEAFKECAFSSITGLFNSAPNWSHTHIFTDTTPAGGKVINKGSLSSRDFLDYLKTCGLPDTWHV